MLRNYLCKKIYTVKVIPLLILKQEYIKNPLTLSYTNKLKKCVCLFQGVANY
jgi:hypothetical protein